MKLSVVIPCYKSEHTVTGVIEEIRAMAPTISDSWEVILVCDNSPDQVFDVIRKLAEKDPEHIVGLELAKNSGQHAALMAGYRLATGDVIASVDDDGQMPVSSLPLLLDRLNEGNDVVFGVYRERKYNFFRNFGSKVNDWMAQWLIGKPADLQISSFFIARRFVIEEIVLYENAFPYILGLLLRVSDRLTNVEVIHRERTEGKSSYTFRKLLRLWLNGFTAFSVKPLRVGTAFGMFIAGISGLCILYLIVDKIFIRPGIPAGYSSLMVGIVFFSGIIMTMLGLLGEYIGRTYICVNKAPQYVIRDATRPDLSRIGTEQLIKREPNTRETIK